MTIHYALVAYKETILSEKGDHKEFTEMIEKILMKAQNQSNKLSYVYDQYLFNYSVHNGLVFLCLNGQDIGRRIPFGFLNLFQQKFEAKYPDTNFESLPPFGLNEFSSDISILLKEFNEGEDKFDKVKQDVSDVKNIMVQNIERVLERGERMDILVNKTDNLNQASIDFRIKSTQLRRKMWWKNIKLMILLGISALFCFYILVSMYCGFLWNSC